MDENGPKPVARLAVPDDGPEMVRLACIMFVSIGLALPDEQWQADAAADVASRLGVDAVGAVVDHPAIAGRLISSGAATVSRKLAWPPNPGGADAYIQWVGTDEEFRKQGCARAVMQTLLDWLDGLGVAAVELHATPMGEPLYRKLGFWEGSGNPMLNRRTWEPPPPA